MKRRTYLGIGIGILIFLSVFTYLMINEFKDDEGYNEWIQAYVDKYGENPPSKNDRWFHTMDLVTGRVTKVYEDRVTVTEYDIKIGFAPNPKKLTEYMILLNRKHKAKKINDKNRIEKINKEIEILINQSQGEIPIIRGGVYKSEGPPLPPAEYAKQVEIAERELFSEYGIEHLYGVLY